MINRGVAFWVVAAISTGIGLFLVKYRVEEVKERIEGINRQIVDNQRATHVLRVEWAHLGELQRIERLNDKYVHLQPIGARQIGRIDQIPIRRGGGAIVDGNKTTPQKGPGTGAPSSTDAPSASTTPRTAARPEAGAPAPASAQTRPQPARARDLPPEPITAGPLEEGEASETPAGPAAMRGGPR